MAIHAAQIFGVSSTSLTEKLEARKRELVSAAGTKNRELASVK